MLYAACDPARYELLGAGVLARIGHRESEQVTNLAAFDVSDADRLALMDNDGPAFASRHPYWFHRTPPRSGARDQTGRPKSLAAFSPKMAFFSAWESTGSDSRSSAECAGSYHG